MTMALPEHVRFFAATDVGQVREHNEDNFLIDKKCGLFAVADGMGGHAAGEIASALAVRTVNEELRKGRDLLEDYLAGRGSNRDVLELLKHGVQQASAQVYAEARSDRAKRGMGTTLDCVLILGNYAFIAHVGDSRVYLCREGRVSLITEDHTVYNELVKRGKLAKEQIEKLTQKNAITRAIGIYERVEVDALAVETIPGDRFLLCSDGLHSYLADTQELQPYLDEMEGKLAIDSLVDMANRRGGRDNITGLMIHINASGPAGDARALQLLKKRRVLNRVPFFARLSTREQLRVMQVAPLREYKDGEELVGLGEKGDELLIVVEGEAHASSAYGPTMLLKVGDYVGEMSLLQPVPSPRAVRAVGTTLVAAIKRTDFFEILRKEHELAVKLLWQFLGVMADRVAQTSRDLHVAQGEQLQAAGDIFEAQTPESKGTPHSG